MYLNDRKSVNSQDKQQRGNQLIATFVLGELLDAKSEFAAAFDSIPSSRSPGRVLSEFLRDHEA